VRKDVIWIFYMHNTIYQSVRRIRENWKTCVAINVISYGLLKAVFVIGRLIHQIRTRTLILDAVPFGVQTKIESERKR